MIVRSLARAFLFALALAAPSISPADDSTPSAEAIAKQILDDGRPEAERRKLVVDNPQLAAAIVKAIAPSPEADSKEEYRRIPWMWRVSVAAGRRNDADEIRGFLNWALPRKDEPLTDWQTVVIGGGMVSGLSDTGAWPAERIGEIIGNDGDLRDRWKSALEMASRQADDDKVPTPTRYDALRLAAMQPWDERAGQLFRYLAKGVHPEVQLGAISALGDMHSPFATQALLSGVEHYPTENKHAMLDAILRDESRVPALLDAISAGRLKRADFADQHLKKLNGVSDQAVGKRIREVLGE